MKNPNGYGSVYKLSGKRRKPYVARITVKTEYDEENDNYILKRKIIGYYSSQAEAVKALALYNDNPCDPQNIDITFGEIWKIVSPKMEAELSSKRMGCYNAGFNYCAPIENKKIKDIRTPHLQKIIDECDKKSSTKQNIKTVMSKVYAYAMQNDFISKDYSQFVSFDKDATEREHILFSSEEVEKCWTRSNEWSFAMVLILLYSGMRINEFLSNKADNIDIDNKTITIPIEIAKNRSSARVIPIHDKILPLLENFKNVGSEYIAVKPNGTKILYSNFMKRDLPHICEFLGQEHTPHDTRHTFITNARKCGLNNLITQRIVGHTPDTITERVYTQLEITELLTEINKIKY